jgi:hypothetical protein
MEINPACDFAKLLASPNNPGVDAAHFRKQLSVGLVRFEAADIDFIHENSDGSGVRVRKLTKGRAAADRAISSQISQMVPGATRVHPF